MQRGQGKVTMSVHAMNHFTVLTDDVERTVAFYREYLGLEPGYRPDLDFPGAWLYADRAPILHVVGGRRRDELKPGVIDHMAFSARGLAAKAAQLDAAGIRYACRRQVGSGVWQVFFLDPNGARIELDFDAAEAAP
ncbi:lactoylglutathione lyase [Burkholderiales bacterium]|nr:lactoylglutathione lyase [Burkholderiales bacterium]